MDSELSLCVNTRMVPHGNRTIDADDEDKPPASESGREPVSLAGRSLLLRLRLLLL
jgi:hypothetical protein